MPLAKKQYRANCDLSRMIDLEQFRTADTWRLALGLLPVPLRDTIENGPRHVLLNGTSSGNFCLDFVGGIERDSQRAAAWSCDVGHYITCAGDSITVNRWDKQSREESYSCRSVIGQLHEFHRHLETTTPDRSRSIVTHVLRIFRQIRTVVGDQDNGARSLKVLLSLLACAATEQYRIVDADLELWGLTKEAVEFSKMIPDATWRPLYNDLSGIGRYQVLQPDFQLVIRHASGALFQEAHLEAQLSPDSWFPGLEGPANIGSRITPRETGIYFTPPALARTLAEEATRDIPDVGARELLIFDPACGSGELLKETLRLLKLRGHVGPVRVIGWDKSSVAIDMARFVLYWEIRAWQPDSVKVEISLRDSLTAEKWPDDVDILVMNPPFKSWQLMEPGEKEVITQLFGSSNKPNLAMAFAQRALGVVPDGGTLAMISPNSLLEASSGRPLRKAIAELLTPQLIARLGEQSIFSRALVDAGMYVGKRNPAHPVAPATVWADSRPNSLNRALRGLRRWRGAEIEPLTDDGFSVYCRKDIGTTSDAWIVRDYESWLSFEKVRKIGRLVPAKKVFDIRQGVRLGSDVFVVTKEYFHKLRKSERRFFRPAVMNVSISEARLNDNYYVFYLYSKGLPPITSEEELEKCVPTYFNEIFLPAKRQLSARKSLVRDNKPWWELLEHRAWNEDYESKIVSKYFGGSRSFAFDKTGQFVVVVGNAWLIKKGAINLNIADDEIYFAALAYLSSSIADELLKYVSIQVSGGQLDLSNKYLGNLLVPNLAKLKASEVSALVQTGKLISEGRTDDWKDVDGLVRSILNR